MPKTHKTKGDDLVNAFDVLPDAWPAVAEVGKVAHAIGAFYGFEGMYVSPVESAAWFNALVRSGMLDDRPPVWCRARTGEDLLLSPSVALGVMRAYVSQRMHALPHPLKIVAEGDAFSLSVPGRNQAHTESKAIEESAQSEPSPMIVRREWALVMIGEGGLVAETEIIQVLWKTCAELGLTHDAVELRINATGCVHCRSSYRTALGGYFRSRLARLCTASKRDLKSNPTHILSCPDERCRGLGMSAPQILDFLCERCKKQLRGLLEFLDSANIPYFLDSALFREGTWLGEIIFAITLRPRDDAGIPPAESARLVVCAEGGRASRAAQVLGGKEMSVVAGTLFLDVVAQSIRARSGAQIPALDAFFVQLGDLAKRRSFEILESLREGGIMVKESLGRDSIKIQLKIAEHLGARYALVLGQKEALDATIIVREVHSGAQETVPQERLVEFVKKKLKK